MSFFDNIKDDVVFLRGALRALQMTTPIAKNPARVFPVVIEELAERYGEAPALISDRESLSYRALAERARDAVLNPTCSRLPIPANMLGKTQQLSFVFRP